MNKTIETVGSLFGSRQGAEEYPPDDPIQIHISISLDLVVSNEQARFLSDLKEEYIHKAVENTLFDLCKRF